MSRSWLVHLMHSARRLATRAISAGNHDFCPSLNRYVYWLRQPVGWFALAGLASLLVGLMLGPQGFVFLAGIVAVAMLGVFWPAISMRGLSAELIFDRPRVSEFQSVQVRLIIHNRWPIPIWGVSLEGGFDLVTGTDRRPVLALGCIRPWSQSEFEWTFAPPQRGIWPISTPRICNGFPFGLWEAHRTVKVPEELLAWPHTFPLDGIPEVSGNSFAVTGMLQPRAGHDGEFIGIRPYRMGDSLRHIHWAQTARQGELIVCERQSHCRRAVRITIDSNLACDSPDEIYQGATTKSSQQEWTIRIGASLCQAFHAHRFQVECAIGSSLFQVPDNAPGIKPILDGLARWQSVRLEAAGTSAGNLRNVLQILVTTRKGLAAQIEAGVDCSQQQIVFLQAEQSDPTASKQPALRKALLEVAVAGKTMHAAPTWQNLDGGVHAA